MSAGVDELPRWVVIVGGAVPAERWRQQYRIPEQRTVVVNSTGAVNRLRGLDGPGAGVVVLDWDLIGAPEVAEAVSRLRQRGAVDLEHGPVGG